MKYAWSVALSLVLSSMLLSDCFAQGAASPGGGASGGAGPGVGGSGGATGGISGGGISTGGIAGGISGGGVTNQLGTSGNQGINSTTGTAGETRGLQAGSLGSGLLPNSTNTPQQLPPSNSTNSRLPYALPGARDLRDPLGIGGASRGASRSSGFRGSYTVPKAENLGPTASADALDHTMHNRNIWKGAAYFPQRGMYEDMVYHPRRGSYRINSGGRPTPRGDTARRAGVRGDRAIDRNGLPIAIRRTTPRMEPNRRGYTEQDRR